MVVRADEDDNEAGGGVENRSDAKAARVLAAALVLCDGDDDSFRTGGMIPKHGKGSECARRLGYVRLVVGRKRQVSGVPSTNEFPHWSNRVQFDESIDSCIPARIDALNV